MAIQQEVPTRFTSTFNMFGSILQAKKGNVDEEAAKKNIKAINQALSETVGVEEYQNLKIKKEILDLVMDLYPLLNGLEEGVTLMGAEKYGTGSSVLPFLFVFNRLLDPDDNDRGYIRDVKIELRNYLSAATKKNLNFDILSRASFLDKRYSTLKFLTDSKQEKVKQDVLLELKEIENLCQQCQ